MNPCKQCAQLPEQARFCLPVRCIRRSEVEQEPNLRQPHHRRELELLQPALAGGCFWDCCHRFP